MIQEGLRYLAGGMNPMDLKRGIEQAIDAVVVELKKMAKPCTTSQEIAHVAAVTRTKVVSPVIERFRGKPYFLG